MPWPPPEIVQKLYASDRWRGKTEEDGRAVRERLGYYCDLQSLNSEDAITWSFLGPLVYGPAAWREHLATTLFIRLGFPKPRVVAIWLWRRIPHPEKCTSNGGPEIDFGIQSEAAVVLGEAKWNSDLAIGQGVGRNRSQFDLRAAYCGGFGPKALPEIRHWAVLGVGRGTDVLDCASASLGVAVHNCSWAQLLALMPSALHGELGAYLAWKDKYSSRRPNKRLKPPAADERDGGRSMAPGGEVT